MFKKFHNDNRGQAMSEYGLLIALVAVGLIVVVGVFRVKLVKIFQDATDSLGAQSQVVGAQPGK